MVTINKTAPEQIFYWLLAMIVLIIIGGYGRQAIAWLLMKLYEFFIQGK